MATPSFNTFRKINYNNPQYQQAMLDSQNRSDYSVNPNTRAITDAYTKAEANRIRGLDEFGIANRMKQEQLEFAKGIQESNLNLEYQKLMMDRQALKDAKKGRDLGMMIGLAQGGMNMYDNMRERQIQQQILEEQAKQVPQQPAQGLGMMQVLNERYPAGFYGVSSAGLGGYY